MCREGVLEVRRASNFMTTTLDGAYHAFLLSFDFASKHQPQRTRQEHRSVRTTAETNQHRKGEVVNGFATPQEDGNDCEQGGTYGVAGTSHGSPDAVIYHVTKAFVTTVGFKRFTKSIKNIKIIPKSLLN